MDFIFLLVFFLFMEFGGKHTTTLRYIPAPIELNVPKCISVLCIVYYLSILLCSVKNHCFLL